MISHLICNQSTNSWQGYVGVPKGHPLFGLDYHDDLPGGLTVDPKIVQTQEQMIENKGVFQLLLSEMEDNYSPIAYEFNVHGGVTFSGYSYWTRLPVVLAQDMLTSKFLKLKRLNDRCGNDLFSHWYNKNRNLRPTEGPACRIHNFREATREITLPHLTSEDGATSKNYYTNGTDVLMGDDKYWWFGWDSNHGMHFTEQEAKEETEKLKNQIQNWTSTHFNV